MTQDRLDRLEMFVRGLENFVRNIAKLHLDGDIDPLDPLRNERRVTIQQAVLEHEAIVRNARGIVAALDGKAEIPRE